jgi:hypothetical protein
MSAPSIYQKACPACGALVSRESRRCECDHVFASVDDGTLLAEEQALQDEELFEAYLAARVEQMISTLESARVELAADPANERKAARLLQTLQDALMLREERDAQAAKTGLARQAAQAARIKASAAAMPEDAGAAQALRQSAEPTAAFRAQQSAKAAKIMEAFENTQTKECPHCKTVLPVNSALCLCGYIFARKEFLHPSHAEQPRG